MAFTIPIPASLSPDAVGFAIAALLMSAWLFLIMGDGPKKAGRAPATTAASTLPRPPSAGLPLIGDTLASLDDALAVRNGRHAQLGPIFTARFMGRRYTSVRGAGLVKKLLQAEHVTVETAWPPRVAELLGPASISTTHFAAHTALRRALAPAFGPAAVAGYVGLMQEVCEEHAAAWAAAGPGLGGAVANKAFTLSIILHVMGFSGGAAWDGPAAKARVNDLFADWLGGFSPTGSGLPGGKMWRARRARAELLRLIRGTLGEMIPARAATLARASEAGEAGSGVAAAAGAAAAAAPACVMDRVVDALLAEAAAAAAAAEGKANGSGGGGAALPSRIPADPLAIMPAAADVALNLLFAGTDTSSTVLTLLLRSLAADPALLGRLRAEQAAVVSAHGPALDAAALEAAPLLTACFKEQLRCVPIVGQLFRRVVVPGGLEVGGFWLPHGEALVLDVADALGTDARWAGEPPASPAHLSKFHPARWIAAPGAGPAAVEALKREGAWIPFGGGPRLCVGYRLAEAEVKAMLCVLLRGYAWTVAAPGTPLVKPPKGLPLPTDGFRVCFAPLGGGGGGDGLGRAKEE